MMRSRGTGRAWSGSSPGPIPPAFTTKCACHDPGIDSKGEGFSTAWAEKAVVTTRTGTRRRSSYNLQMHATIRAGTAGDLDAVLRLWRLAEVEPSHTDNLGSLQQLVAFDPGALLVAEAGDALVGSVIAGWDGWRGSIYRLAVAPDHRRRGLAGELVNAAAARLRAAGATRLQAIVVENDDGATGFWNASSWDRQVQRVRFVNG